MKSKTKILSRLKNITALFAAGMMLILVSPSCKKSSHEEEQAPRIINIVNFIRQCEPRIEWITEDVLYETVVSQVEMMKEYGLPGTFLLQYDALIDQRYQDLLKALPPEQFEIGAWWEIPQPLVENSGYEWRGRYQWDWHADVGFATGYTPEEREKLVDTYMADFKNIFGYWPKSVGSWFIDAHSLGYMYDKYGITASCNCKDQIGTDGYTMWGGYWSQAYYPSRKNAYMPAQNAENQIPVPIFRMLGSDPIHQYDNGLGGSVQRVVSLEPVYKGGGGNREWCNWYYDEFVEGECLAFAYTQTGQENSFAWQRMEEGFRIQMPIIDSLRKAGQVVVQTLAESGEWFKNQYQVTPPTSVTVLSDHTDKNLKTVWFNSRFYRANLLWENGTLRFRDIHLFDESLESGYLTQKGTTTSCNYYTLPVLDGFLWSSTEIIAGLRFRTGAGEQTADLTGGDPEVIKDKDGRLLVAWPVTVPEGRIEILMDESTISISSEGKALKNWFLEYSWSDDKEIPITDVSSEVLKFSYMGFGYSISAISGTFIKGPGGLLRIMPGKKGVSLSLGL